MRREERPDVIGAEIMAIAELLILEMAVLVQELVRLEAAVQVLLLCHTRHQRDVLRVVLAEQRFVVGIIIIIMMGQIFINTTAARWISTFTASSN